MAPVPDHVDDEMHELNQEADYLDQTVRVDTPGVNGQKSKSRNGSSDPDAEAQVIDSLRSQIQDLFSQVSQLNNKLVRSYDRVSDLEDELHVTSGNLRNATLKVSQLELERAQHLSALSTGLLVEKSHVTTELTRLMEQATEQAARAGEAESAKATIEKDLDDLSATLFDQANTMVAEARLARARSERKAEETEEALRGAEEIVGMLQTQLQTLQGEKEESDKKMQDMNALVGKGKWVERPQAPGPASKVRLLCLHAPYLEYMQFIAHLRSIKPASAQPPAMPALLPQPFLARLLAEDSDPTVRLDLAPQLNWLTRRSVLAAIHSGYLSIEPMSTTTLLEELAHSSIPGNSHTHVSCALCGSAIIDSPTSPTRSTFAPTRSVSAGKSWAPALLKTSLVQSFTSASFGHSRPATPTTPVSEPPAHVFIFRLEATTSSGLPLPMSTPQPNSPARPPTIYPLCVSGWCLTRLRTTCSLWAFIRTNVVEKVWEEETLPPQPTLNVTRAHSSDSDLQATAPAQPTLEPKRSRMGIGALWGSMSRSLSNPIPKTESAQADTQNAKAKEEPEKPSAEKPVPPVPPRRLPPAPPRNLPPPPPRHPPLAAPIPRPAPATGAPPPLPKRSLQRTASPAIHDPPTAPATPELDSSAVPPATALSPSDEHDSFTTPTEEIANPHADRPMSPSAVPLPPSAPSTPVPTAVHPPERSESPARAATPQGDKPPVPPRGSAPPPPLPRRAAARARPVSLIPPEASAVAEATEPKVPQVDGPPAPVPEVVTEEPKEPEVEEVKEEAKEELKPEAPAEDPAATVEAEPATLQDSHPQSAELLEELKEPVDEEAKEAEEPIESSKEGSLKSLEVVSLANGSDKAEDDDTRVVNLTPDSASDSTGSDDEPGTYVGTSTWEERTWKELVKLREEMFWARIGGIR